MEVNPAHLQITVLQIDALKKVKKGTRILLLDKNGGGAKDVAKGLSSKGYKRVFVIQNGFNGWSSSKLQTRPSSSVSPHPFLSLSLGSPPHHVLYSVSRGHKIWIGHNVEFTLRDNTLCTLLSCFILRQSS